MIYLIAKNELKRVWVSPIAWILFALALFVLGLLLLVLLNNFYSEIQAKLVNLQRAPGLTDLVIAPYLFWSAIIGVLIVPLFAVRSSTEEQQYGAHLLLTSSAVGTMQIVLAKYLALMFLALIFIFVSSSYALVLGYFTAIDYGKIAGICLGVFLFIASFNAAALFIANLTRTPIIASATILALLAIFAMLHVSGSAAASSSELFLYLSNYSHLIRLLSGTVDTADLAYFVLFALLFLKLCYITLKFRQVA